MLRACAAAHAGCGAGLPRQHFSYNVSAARYSQRRPRDRSCCEAVVGIDLGTTNSSVALLEDGQPAVFRDQHGRDSFPSVVAVSQEGRVCIGQEAVDLGAGPSETFYSFKRLIGRRFEESAGDVARLLYTVQQPVEPGGEPVVWSARLGAHWPAKELSAMVLRHLVCLVEAQLGEQVEGAVVTVPAHFGRAQQEGTVAAARHAGIGVVHLLQEPVAAALAYGISGGTDGETILVFDLGGGTFDVSILQAFEGIIEVLGTGGDAYLGGDDFDVQLAAWLEQQLGQPCSWEWVLKAAEQAKTQLSASNEASITTPSGQTLTLREQDFEQATLGLFERLAEPLERLGSELFVEWAVQPAAAVPHAPGPSGTPRTGSLAAEASHPWAPPPRRITQVVLVGQMCRLPAVQRFVARLTGLAPTMTVDPAHAVALGAAAQAGILLGQLGGVELMDSAYSAALHGRSSGLSNWQP